MRSSKFHYNSRTCQYEPVPLRARPIIIYCLGLLMVSATLFSAFTIIYDRLTVTPVEAQLKKENEILGKHQVVLASQLASVENTLARLKKEDKHLYQKIFEETSANGSTGNDNQKDILMAEAGDFRNLLKDITLQSEQLYERSVTSNAQFSTLAITKTDAKILNALPTRQPITNTSLDLLVSGFGVRINPFHKGKYMHPGIDFAAPRGTDVFAAAPGKVVDINKSDLKAGYGNSIDIDHGYGFITRYAHLEEIKVRSGQAVTKGMVIGTVGSSGGSIAPHLHYEIIHRGENVDPMNYMFEGLSSHDYNRLLQLSKKQNQSLD